MATRRLTSSSFQYYKNQRFLVISLVFIGLMISLLLSILTLFVFPDLNFLQSITFFFLIAFVGGVIYARQLLVSLNMRFHYFRMIEEQVPPLEVKNLPFHDSFSSLIIKDGYEQMANKPNFIIYVKIFKNVPFVKRTGPTILWLIHIVDASIPFHDASLDEEINYIKEKKLNHTDYANELSLIFKKVPIWNASMMQSFQEIINFSLQNRALISLPVAVIEDKRMVYTLRPMKQYPNKYYYALIQILDTICETKEVVYGK
jgi:hypothetical protein